MAPSKRVTKRTVDGLLRHDDGNNEEADSFQGNSTLSEQSLEENQPDNEPQNAGHWEDEAVTRSMLVNQLNILQEMLKKQAANTTRIEQEAKER